MILLYRIEPIPPRYSLLPRAWRLVGPAGHVLDERGKVKRYRSLEAAERAARVLTAELELARRQLCLF